MKKEKKNDENVDRNSLEPKWKHIPSEPFNRYYVIMRNMLNWKKFTKGIENRIHSDYWISLRWSSVYMHIIVKISISLAHYGTFPNRDIFKAIDRSYRKHSIESTSGTIANTRMQSLQKLAENSPSPSATHHVYYNAPNCNPQTMQ